jgi:hypothetical protein
VPWTGDASGKPKQADFKAWVGHVCSITLSGQTHEHRRHLLKALLDEAWALCELTHARESLRMARRRSRDGVTPETFKQWVANESSADSTGCQDDPVTVGGARFAVTSYAIK